MNLWSRFREWLKWETVNPLQDESYRKKFVEDYLFYKRNGRDKTPLDDLL